MDNHNLFDLDTNAFLKLLNASLEEWQSQEDEEAYEHLQTYDAVN